MALADIELRRLSKQFPGGNAALKDLDLAIPSGELLVVLGPSGSGKTTLLRMLAGLESPQSGEVWMDGRNITTRAPHRRDMAMVFQNPALYPHLTVFDNLAFGLRARRVPRSRVRTMVNTVAGLLGLDAVLGRRPASLSGGERQRVALGRAIVRQPRVLLCDEPFSSLDPPLRASLREEVLELHRRFGSTVVLVTHDQADALLMGDRIAILDRGRLLQCGAPRDVYQRPEHRFVASFVGSPPMNLLPCELVREGDSTRVHLVAADPHLSWAMPAVAGPCGWPASAQVVLGIRPEAITVHPPGVSSASSYSPAFDAHVRRLQFNGPEILATLSLGPHRLVARLPAGLSLDDRQNLRVVLDLGQAVWFEPESGKALAQGQTGPS